MFLNDKVMYVFVIFLKLMEFLGNNNKCFFSYVICYVLLVSNYVLIIIWSVLFLCGL